MNIVLNRSTVADFGIYKEAGAIVLGFKFSHDAPIHTLIVQIEAQASELATDNAGMYVEIDDAAFYGGVLDFQYNEADERIRLELATGKYRGINVIQIEIPLPLNADERQLLRELVSSYNSSLARKN